MQRLEMRIETLERIVHGCVNHLEFLKRQEGSLPPDEIARLETAKRLEAQLNMARVLKNRDTIVLEIR